MKVQKPHFLFSQCYRKADLKIMNEMFIAEIAKKIMFFIVALIGILMLLFGISVWVTNGTIIDRVDQRVIHDTIYLPLKK